MGLQEGLRDAKKEICDLQSKAEKERSSKKVRDKLVATEQEVLELKKKLNENSNLKKNVEELSAVSTKLHQEMATLKEQKTELEKQLEAVQLLSSETQSENEKLK